MTNFRNSNLAYFLIPLLCPLFYSFTIPYEKVNRLRYEVWIGEKRVGSVLVEKWTNAEQEYIFSAKTNIDFLFWQIHSTIESKYRNQQLWTACAKETINGKDRDCSQTAWIDSEYQISKNKIKSVLKCPINYSVVMLYHHEPQQMSSIFAERHTKFCTIKELTPHKYELTAPNGDKNYYSYKDGICEEMQTNIMMKKIKFILVK